MVAETHLSVGNLVYPLFVHEGKGRIEIESMPGQYRWPMDEIARVACQTSELGIPAVILFGLPASKDDRGSAAYARNGVVQAAAARIKDATPDLVVIADTCLDEYTTHGHCGIVVNGEVDNDATVEVLARVAVSQADAGVDMVAPSDMMDGRVGAIRAALDEAGHVSVSIMAYSAKFASAFYGPFREAADCAPAFGDRRSYQMDPRNVREALREVELDVSEGADMVMIKPALAYLDVIRAVCEAVDLPVAAYNVSGEYAMVKAAARNGWIDERAIVMEIVTAISRAGAGPILTYHAPDIARWLSEC